MPNQPQLTSIRRWAQELGFQDIGVSDLDLSDYKVHLERYLERGFHGDMGYLARNKLKRLNPAELVPDTARVISARMNYLPPGTQPLKILDDPSLGYISRYALGRDYHKVLRKRLGQLASRINTNFGHNAASPPAALRAFTDSAPVLEKALAEKAGLGWIGKHTLLLNEDVGSWFFLGEVFTSLDLPVTNSTPQSKAGSTEVGRCGNCKACITVCPTDAIVGPQELDARRCISYLTIENKGAIPQEFRKQMGNRVFGCDDCQLFCPWNRSTTETEEADFTPRNKLDQTSLVKLFEWTCDEFEQNTRGSAIRRISFDQWQRNLAIGLGNGPFSHAAVAALRARQGQASALVKEHIDWALDELIKKS